MNVKDIVVLSALTTILFVSEQLLSFIPNVQITFLLLFVYSGVLKTKKTLLIILIHVLLDNLFMSSFNIAFIPFMFIGYSLIPITINLFKIESEIKLSFLGALLSVIYTTLYVIPNVILLNINFIDYLIADIPFTIILAISSFVSILWLYKPIKNKLEVNIKKKL